MKNPIERALEAASDAADVDWDALERDATDTETRETLRALRALTALVSAHRLALPQRELPFMWGPLEVRAHIAHGAHGDVYRAWDPQLHRDVALKLLRDAGPDSADGPPAIAEGRRLARVRHPNVVTIHGADRIEGQAGIWMEFVDGSTLREIVTRQGPMPAAEVIEVGIAVCSGLAAIHETGLGTVTSRPRTSSGTEAAASS